MRGVPFQMQHVNVFQGVLKTGLYYSRLGQYEPSLSIQMWPCRIASQLVISTYLGAQWGVICRKPFLTHTILCTHKSAEEMSSGFTWWSPLSSADKSEIHLPWKRIYCARLLLWFSIHFHRNPELMSHGLMSSGCDLQSCSLGQGSWHLSVYSCSRRSCCWLDNTCTVKQRGRYYCLLFYTPVDTIVKLKPDILGKAPILEGPETSEILIV